MPDVIVTVVGYAYMAVTCLTSVCLLLDMAVT